MAADEPTPFYLCRQTLKAESTRITASNGSRWCSDTTTSIMARRLLRGAHGVQPNRPACRIEIERKNAEADNEIRQRRE